MQLLDNDDNTNVMIMKEGGGGGGGGGQKTKWKTLFPNFEELIESITNMLLGGSLGKNVMRFRSWGCY